MSEMEWVELVGGPMAGKRVEVDLFAQEVRFTAAVDFASIRAKPSQHVEEFQIPVHTYRRQDDATFAFVEEHQRGIDGAIFRGIFNRSDRMLGVLRLDGSQALVVGLNGENAVLHGGGEIPLSRLLFNAPMGVLYETPE